MCSTNTGKVLIIWEIKDWKCNNILLVKLKIYKCLISFLTKNISLKNTSSLLALWDLLTRVKRVGHGVIGERYGEINFHHQMKRI